MYFTRLDRSLHLAQTMVVEVLTMVVAQVETTLEVLLHTRNQTLPSMISLPIKLS